MTGRRLLLAAGSVLDAEPAAVIDVAAAAGFDGVSLRLVPDHLHGDSGRRWTEWADRATSSGVEIHDVEVHRIGPDAPDPGVLIEAAATLGARAVLVVSDLADRDATEELLGRFVQRCLAGGVAAALEYMAWTTPSTPGDAVRMAEATGAILVADVLHHHRVGAGPAELAEIVASGRLGWVQLADGPAIAPADLLHEARHGRLVPGTGELPLGELLRVVPDDVVISVEVQSDELTYQYPPDARADLLFASSSAVLTALG